MMESVKHIYKVYAWYNLSEQRVCGPSRTPICFSKYIEGVIKRNPESSEGKFIKKYATRENNENRK